MTSTWYASRYTLDKYALRRTDGSEIIIDKAFGKFKQFGKDLALSRVLKDDQRDDGLFMRSLALAPLDACLLAQHHQIEIHPPAVSTTSEKIERCIVLQMS